MQAWHELAMALALLTTAGPAGLGTAGPLAPQPASSSQPSLQLSRRHSGSASIPASITGIVIDANSAKGIAEAEVTLRGSKLSALTDASGRFAMDTVQPGHYQLEISRLGYRTRRDSVSVEPGSNISIEAQLSEQAIALAPIDVTVRESKLMEVGFYDRQAHGMGMYFTREDIRRSGARRLSDLLAGVAGLRRTIGANGVSQFQIRGIKTFYTSCKTQYFLDGVQADINVLGPDIIPIRDIEGIEIYKGSAEIPMQFNVGNSMCGAILIWTRDGRR